MRDCGLKQWLSLENYISIGKNSTDLQGDLILLLKSETVRVGIKCEIFFSNNFKALK